MADTTAPPSRSSRSPRRGGRPRPDVRAWLTGIRSSGFAAIMLGLVVLAAFVLVPTIGTYLDQRQRVAALEAAVELGEERVADLEAQRERWSDPAYITTQARERLYFVAPGEVVYLIDNDLPPQDVPREPEAVSDEVQTTETEWMGQMMRSITEAGLSRTVSGTPAP